jgi:hypothetical protein
MKTTTFKNSLGEEVTSYFVETREEAIDLISMYKEEVWSYFDRMRFHNKKAFCEALITAVIGGHNKKFTVICNLKPATYFEGEIEAHDRVTERLSAKYKGTAAMALV